MSKVSDDIEETKGKDETRVLFTSSDVFVPTVKADEEKLEIIGCYDPHMSDTPHIVEKKDEIKNN